jgi:hypothetical protein
MTPRTAVLCILLAAAIPAQAKRVTLAKEVTVDFPETWFVQQDTRDTLLATHTMAGAKSPDATMTVHLERRRTHEEALQRLAQFATEHPAEPGWRVLAGGRRWSERSPSPSSTPVSRKRSRCRAAVRTRPRFV